MFKQDPRDVDIFLGRLLFGMFEISSPGKEILRLFVNFIKVLCTFSITSVKYAKARGNGICAD